MSETISKDDTENEKKIAQEWFRELRDQFCNKFEEIDGGKFTRKTWKHSGEGGGEKQMNDDPERVKEGQLAAQKIADNMLRRLHWAIICGNEGGDLNDILYTVKALGMVVSTDVDFDSGPAVMNGFSLRWQSVFGGIGEYFENGEDNGGYAGVHARSAIGGFTGRFSIEPEMIVAIPPELSIAIIKNRGWLFPIDPKIESNLQRKD